MRFLRHTTGAFIHIDTSAPLYTGGEGRIYPVPQDPSLVAKIYDRNHLTIKRISKLCVMLVSPPETESIAVTGHIPIACPVDLIRTADDGHRIVGFLMPRVIGMRPIAEFYNPKARRERFPLFNTRYLHRAACNLAAAMHALHTSGYVVGDVNESNIFASNTALVTIVDTDSFQVRDPRAGTLYRCGVGRPEFTPPELQGAHFGYVDRTPTHDFFGLAVLIFQLLMEGTHPYEGIFQGTGDPPSYQERIAAGHFPYGCEPRIPYLPKPSAPSLHTLHPSIQTLFIHCFERSRHDPLARPDAKTWQTTLEQAEQALVVCNANDQHLYGRHLDHCPWCDRAEQLGKRDPFPSRQTVEAGTGLSPIESPPPPQIHKPPPVIPMPVAISSPSFSLPPRRRARPRPIVNLVTAGLVLTLALQVELHPAVWIGVLAVGCGIVGWRQSMIGRGASFVWAALGMGAAMLLLFLQHLY